MILQRAEINVKRLLRKCEEMANDLENEDWRLEQFVYYLDKKINELKNDPYRSSDEVVASYSRRLEFLKGVLHVKQMDTPLEKIVAVQLSPKGCHEESKQIQQKTQEKVHMELRHELFSKQGELRKRKSLSMNSNPSQDYSDVEDDMDSLLKYHHSLQEKIADNMLVLAHNIKEQTLLAGNIIRNDTQNVEKATELADKNYEQLRIESEKLQEQNSKAWRFWIWILLIIVIVIFINMVLFMKVTKKKNK